MVEDDETRTEDHSPHDSSVVRGPRLRPPALPVAVDSTGTLDDNLLGIRGAHERLRARCPDFGLGRIIRMVGRAKQRRTSGDVERDVALQHDWRGKKRPARELHRPTPSAGAIVNRRLDGLGVLGRTIRLRPIGSRVAHLPGGDRGKRSYRHHRHRCCHRQPNTQTAHSISRSASTPMEILHEIGPTTHLQPQISKPSIHSGERTNLRER